MNKLILIFFISPFVIFILSGCTPLAKMGLNILSGGSYLKGKIEAEERAIKHREAEAEARARLLQTTEKRKKKKKSLKHKKGEKDERKM